MGNSTCNNGSNDEGSIDNCNDKHLPLSVRNNFHSIATLVHSDIAFVTEKDLIAFVYLPIQTNSALCWILIIQKY